MSEDTSHYAILQVSETACPEVIQSAYRTLQRQFHPDAGGTGELANALNRARDILLDPVERNRYDATLKISGRTSNHSGANGTSHSSNGTERTYAICLKCRTRTMVDYHALDGAKCFGCNEYLIHQAKSEEILCLQCGTRNMLARDKCLVCNESLTPRTRQESPSQSPVAINCTEPARRNTALSRLFCFALPLVAVAINMPPFISNHNLSTQAAMQIIWHAAIELSVVYLIWFIIEKQSQGSQTKGNLSA